MGSRAVPPRCRPPSGDGPAVRSREPGILAVRNDDDLVRRKPRHAHHGRPPQTHHLPRQIERAERDVLVVDGLHGADQQVTAFEFAAPRVRGPRHGRASRESHPADRLGLKLDRLREQGRLPEQRCGWLPRDGAWDQPAGKKSVFGQFEHGTSGAVRVRCGRNCGQCGRQGSQPSEAQASPRGGHDRAFEAHTHCLHGTLAQDSWADGAGALIGCSRSSSSRPEPQRRRKPETQKWRSIASTNHRSASCADASNAS